METLDRDDACREAFRFTAVRKELIPAFRIVEENAGLLAACVAVRGKRGLQPLAEVRHGRIRVAHRARRAYRGTAAAAGAEMGLDVNLVAGVADRAARADVDAGVTALLSRPAVGANLLAVVEEARLFE